FTEDNVDIGIRFGVGVYPGLVAEKLFEESVFPVCSPHLLGGKKPGEAKPPDKKNPDPLKQGRGRVARGQEGRRGEASEAGGAEAGGE
ncbi:MAG: hypothetical protein HC781_15335, partial [Leptolyngbyaceae cyanobacterium CSU_1_4]|nr:hypothetical protein [Leptolyngbyaceae cyanobacterium CSU_1_4]